MNSVSPLRHPYLVFTTNGFEGMFSNPKAAARVAHDRGGWMKYGDRVFDSVECERLQRIKGEVDLTGYGQ